MELTPVVNFINILNMHFCMKVLCASFFYLHATREKLPKKCARKITKLKHNKRKLRDSISYEKAAHKKLMELTPVVNFINNLRTNFLYKHRFGSFFYVHVTREKLWESIWYEKFAYKMLMKLAPERAVRQKVDNFCETRILLRDHYPNWAFPDKDPKDKESSEHV